MQHYGVLRLRYESVRSQSWCLTKPNPEEEPLLRIRHTNAAMPQSVLEETLNQIHKLGYTVVSVVQEVQAQQFLIVIKRQ